MHKPMPLWKPRCTAPQWPISILSDMAACAGTEIALDDRSMFADVVTLDWGEGNGPEENAADTHVFSNDST